jgi:hypothetical protein
MKKRIAVAVVAALAVLLLGGGAAYAMSQNGVNAAAANVSTGVCAKAACKHAPGAAGERMLLRLIGRSISGQFVVRDPKAPGGFATIAFARGQISSLDTSARSLTVQLANGTSQTFTLDTSTKIRAGKTANASIGDLHTGENVLVITRQVQGQAVVVAYVIAHEPGAKPGAGTAPQITNTPVTSS